MLRISAFLLMLFLLPASLAAQAVPAAKGGNGALWIGAKYGNYKADFAGNSRVQGAGFYFRAQLVPRWGIEGKADFLNVSNFHDETEKSYLIGPAFSLRPYSRIKPFARFLVGVGSIRFPFKIGDGTYAAYAPGGGVDIRVRLRWRLRAEYEYQLWPKAPNIIGQTNTGLKPNGFGAGIAYRLF